MSFSQELAAMGLAELVKNMISMKNNKTSSKKDMESMMKKIVHECLAEQEKKNTTEMNSVVHGMMALLQESIRRPTEERQFSELCDMMKKMNVEKEKEEASQKTKEEIVRELIKALGDISDDPKDNSGQMQEDRRGNDRGNQFRGNRNRGHSNYRGRDMQLPDGRNDRDQSYRNNRQRSEGRGNFRGRGDFHRERNFTRNDFQRRDNRQNNASFVDRKNFEYGKNVNEMQDGACALPLQQDLSAEARPFRGEPYQHYGPPGAGQFHSANTGPFADHSSKFPQGPHPWNMAPTAPLDVLPPLFPPPPPPYSKDDPYFQASSQENRSFVDYKQDHGRNDQRDRQYFHNQKFQGGQKKFQHHGNLHNKELSRSSTNISKLTDEDLDIKNSEQKKDKKLGDRKHNFHNRSKTSDEKPAIVNVTKDGKPYIADEKGEKKNKKRQNNKKGKKQDKNAPQISVVDSNESSSGSEEESTKANQESQDFKLLLGGEFKEENISKIKDLNAEVKNVIQITIVGDETISYHPKTVGELIDFKKKHPNCQTLLIEKSEVKNVEKAEEAKEGKLI